MTPDMPPAVPVEAPQTVVTVAAAQSPAQTIVVESHGYRYEVIGNTLLKQKVIEARLRKAADPKAALAVLNQAYKKAGYFLVVLRGIVSGKTVSIQVIQGRLTETEISPDLEWYFSGLEGREDLTRRDVLRRSAMAELYTARQGLRPKVNFAPAQEVGGSKMVVTEEPLENAKPWNANLGFGNYGNRYSSRFLAQGGVALRPGGGVELTANYTHGLPSFNSESSGSLYTGESVGGSVITPWGIYGAGYNYIKYQISKEGSTTVSGVELRPEGRFKIPNVYGNQLLYADEVWRWGLNEGFTHTDFNSTATVFSLFPEKTKIGKFHAYAYPSPRAVSDQNYNFVNVGTSFSRTLQPYGQNASLSGSLNYSRGTNGTINGFGQEFKYSSEPKNPTTGPLVPDTQFNLLNWNFAYTQNLPESFRAGINLTGQWTNTTLPLNQQWVLGGYGNLTAWFPGVVAGDKGMLASASVSRSWEWGPLSLSPSLFVEAGYSQWDFVPSHSQVSHPLHTQETQFLSDVGIGLAASLKGGTGFTMGSAVPLTATSGGKDYGVDKTSNRAYLYFNLTQAF